MSRAIRLVVPFVLLLVLGGVGCNTTGQQATKTFAASSDAGLRFPDGKDAVRVPFDPDFGLVFVQARVNGSEPRPFVLDTGFDVTVLDAGWAGELGIGPAHVKSVDQPGGAVETGFLPALTFGIGGLEIGCDTAQAIPLAQLQPFVGRRIGGVLGHDVIRRLVVRIDYQGSVLGLHAPETYQYSGAGEVLPLLFDDQGQVFVEGSLLQPGREPIPGRFKLDTGSMDALGLARNYAESVALVRSGQKVLPVPGLAVGGETQGFLTRTAGFRLGDSEFERPVVGVTTESAGFEDRANAGTLGGEILNRFTVVLDYRRERMILERNDRFRAPFRFDMSGMWLVAEGDDFGTLRVLRVFADSPAARAGVHDGDVLHAVDEQPAAEWGLADLWRAFRAEEGRTFRLELRRDERTLETTLVTESMI